MNSKAVKQILNLNNEFYQSVSKEFSKSRKYPWKGWESIEIKGPVLDIGCGNGRFYDYICRKSPEVEYLGIDINNDLLLEAKQKYKEATFKKLDIFTGLEKIRHKYKLVVAFGITHHIPDNNFRIKWFEKLPKLVDKGGSLVLSFWIFEDKPGDYILGWDNAKNVRRYCHQYSEDEINKIIFMYKDFGLVLTKKYLNDNKNLYLVFDNINL